MRRPEILAPAGDRDAMAAALAAGADAVYFGLDDGFNARARAENFSSQNLAEVVAWIHRAGARAYVTLNTLVFEPELPVVEELIRRVAAAGVDAIIVQDPAVALLARAISPSAVGRTPRLEVHASTQMTASSPLAVGLLETLGLSRVVVPRELSVEEIRAYRQGTDVELEVFVHGALCVAWSGQCLSSEAWGGRSANRGQCAQACRLPYSLVVDDAVQDLGEVEYLLSPKDLVGLDAIAALADIGVASLKIEGRLKGPSYVATAVAQYRNAAARSVGEVPPTPPVDIPLDPASLHVAYSRGVSRGFLGGADHQTLVEGRFPRHRGLPIGRVIEVAGDEVEVVRDPDQRPVTGGRASGDRAADNRASDSKTSDSRAADDRWSDERHPDGHVRLADVRAGMGVVFDAGEPDKPEQGGPIFAAAPTAKGHRLRFGNPGPDLSKVRVGDFVWVSSDPKVTRAGEKAAEAGREALGRIAVDFEVSGAVGAPLEVRAVVRGKTHDAHAAAHTHVGTDTDHSAHTHVGTNTNHSAPTHVGTDTNHSAPAHVGTNTDHSAHTHVGTNTDHSAPTHVGTNTNHSAHTHVGTDTNHSAHTHVGTDTAHTHVGTNHDSAHTHLGANNDSARVGASQMRAEATARSKATLAAARGAGISRELILDKLGGLGGTPFHAGTIDTSRLAPGLHLPVSELKELRRSIVAQLEVAIVRVDREVVATSRIDHVRAQVSGSIDSVPQNDSVRVNDSVRPSSVLDADAGASDATPKLVALCRNDAQLDAVLDAGADEVELDWMELVGLARAVERAKARDVRVGVATVRVQKPGEEKIDAHLARLAPDAVLVRSWGSLAYFKGQRAGLVANEEPTRAPAGPTLHGDFSLNVTNSITAGWVLGHGVETITAAHDLDRDQLMALLAACPRGRVAVTIHHHIPTFHTEHCVYAHLLSDGRDYRTCGRPCEKHEVALRDRVGLVHPVIVDVGCRNTVFNAQAQSAATLVPDLLSRGVRRFRIELVRETAEETRRLYTAYAKLVSGTLAPAEVVRAAAVHEQFGVTRGTMRTLTVLR